MFGAFIGDAAGGVLEFGGLPNASDVNWALTLQGGGALNLGAGQITDDSEMAMCILHGLFDPECKIHEAAMNMDGMAYYYGQWAKRAFDIGFTT